MGDFLGIPSWGWAAILTPVVMWSLLMIDRKPATADPDGWTRLRPTIALNLLGLISALFGLASAAISVAAFLVPANESAVWGLRALSPPLTALFMFGAYGIFVARVAFGESGLRYRGLFRRFIVPWSDVIEIVDSVALGPYVRTLRGRLFVWKSFRGFPQLIDELKARGIKGADNPSLLRSP